MQIENPGATPQELYSRRSWDNGAVFWERYFGLDKDIW